MKHAILGITLSLIIGQTAPGQETCPNEVHFAIEFLVAQQSQPRVVHQVQPQGVKEAQPVAETPEETVLRARIQSYVEAFNQRDAAAVGRHWASNGVSVDQETGEETVGRDAIVEDLKAFFEQNPGARLRGELDTLRMVRPDVAVAEGRASLLLPDADPVDSAVSVLFVKENDEWLISSSQERDLPVPATPYDALQDLEWLIGTWQDQTDDAQVETTIRWSPNRAFLLRSFSAQFPDGEAYEGTQVIGWDPAAQQIRTWSFYSDGAFGEGTVSRHDEDWVVKMSQVGSDGSLNTGTQIITPVDDNTIRVQMIGETADGEPLPTRDPVTVVRTATADPVSGTEVPASEGGVQ